MKLDGVHHVSLVVRDLAAARRFYVEALELEEIPRPPFPFPGAWLRSGAQEIHLIEEAGFEPPKGQHFAFRTSGLDALRERLTARGVEVRGPIDVPGAGRQAFLRDPTGNLIELNEPRA